MITLETAVSLAVKHPLVMDQLGEALCSDLVTSNAFLRKIVEFADTFLMQKRRLPSDGDWEVWLGGLQDGMERDGTSEVLGRVLAMDVSEYDAEFFSAQVIKDLQQIAAQAAVSRLNALPDAGPEALLTLAEKVAAVQYGALPGLARLSDVDTWVRPVREDEYVSTGFPTLNHLISGWGKELWLIFADSGVGKSLLLQNFAVNAATRGKHVLHITLEIGMRPQIHRYYRQIAQMDKGEFNADPKLVKQRVRHWFRLARGQVSLLEFPAFDLDPDTLRRAIERVQRSLGKVDLLVLDYLDLMSPSKRRSSGDNYVDLGRLTHEVRGVCGAFDMGVLSASQAVRKPARAGRLTMADMGDSYGKVRGVDGLLSLVQTPEEEEVHQGRLGVLKVRDSGGRGTEIGLYMNRDLSLIQELANPNTAKLMERLGHLPHQLAAKRPPKP